MIPYGKQDINQTDIDSVINVLQSDFLTQGPQIPLFEKTVSSYCNSDYGVAVNSGTSALHIACLALDLKEGDWLWTSTNSFVASANCGLYCGAKVDFVDINPKTYKEKPTIIPTFAEIADIVLEIKNAELTNEKHKAQWRSTLEQYAYPTIGSLPVNQITVDHIHSLLDAIWLQKTETASRLRGRIQVVLNYAIVKKMMSAPNHD